MGPTMRTLLWFRGKDLRLADHRPLREALDGGPVIPLFVLDPHWFRPERAATLPHRMEFLLGSVAALQEEIRRRGSHLQVVAGRSVEVVPLLARAWRVDRVLAQAWVDPVGRTRDERVAAALSVPFHRLEGETLVPPGSLRSGSGTPYAVFSAFARAFRVRAEAVGGDLLGPPVDPPDHLPPLPPDVAPVAAALPTMASLGLASNPRLPPPGEAAARSRLAAFLAGPARRYDLDRDRLDLDGTSRLSADLKFGTLSIRTAWFEVGRAVDAPDALRRFQDELLWREFAHHTLHDRPEVLSHPFQPAFEGFPWTWDEEGWAAWVEGRTGFPVVDAAARQLLRDGFVHNRARMIAASFLTRLLCIDFRRGEAHYLRFLVDGDPAQNDLGWQWSAGCGCDAVPWFRVFNPVLQGERFDPEGTYVRRYLPELADVPARFIHRPWTAPADVLRRAGLPPGSPWRAPRVDAGAAREAWITRARRHLAAARVTPGA